MRCCWQTVSSSKLMLPLRKHSYHCNRTLLLSHYKSETVSWTHFSPLKRSHLQAFTLKIFTLKIYWLNHTHSISQTNLVKVTHVKNQNIKNCNTTWWVDCCCRKVTTALSILPKQNNLYQTNCYFDCLTLATICFC